MKEWDNNGNLVTKPTGCWNCEYLDYFEKDSYESYGSEGWMCDWNENAENFKTFPCKRKLKCFVLDKERQKSLNDEERK